MEFFKMAPCLRGIVINGDDTLANFHIVCLIIVKWFGSRIIGRGTKDFTPDCRTCASAFQHKLQLEINLPACLGRIEFKLTVAGGSTVASRILASPNLMTAMSHKL